MALKLKLITQSLPRLLLLASCAVVLSPASTHASTLSWQSAEPSTVKAQASNTSVTQSMAREIAEHSQMMKNLEEMCDDIGPRLTGSPQLRQAQQWAMEKLKSYGAINVHEEAYDLGRPWKRGTERAQLLSANRQALDIRQQAWTEGTKGVVRGEVVLLDVQTLAQFKAVAPSLKGKIVLALSTPRATPEERKDFQAYSAALNETLRVANFSMILFVSERVGSLQDMSGSPGSRYNKNAGIITQEHANLLKRLIARGQAPRIEVELGGGFQGKPIKAYNVVADLPGTEKTDEMVILGVHQDSWDLASGATDNGVGVVVMMEVLRTMKALGLQPKRSLRLVLFSGEEQGLLGSKAYVETHRHEWEKIQAMLTQDAGGGRIDGFPDMQVDAWYEALTTAADSMKEIADLEIVYARGGGSDQEAFFEKGIPAFGPRQEVLDYLTHTWHSQVDTIDHVKPANLIHNAQVIAGVAWSLLNGDKLPHQKVNRR